MPSNKQSEDTATTLDSIQFFCDFPADLVHSIEKAATLRRLKKNTHIIVCGEESHSFYVLIEGSAYAYTEDDQGNEFIVGSFGAGDYFGELGVLDNRPRSASVKTTGDCLCQVIPRSVLIHAIEQNSAAAIAVVHSLVDRIRGMTEDVSCLALMDVYGRLVRTLMNDAKQDDEGTLRTAKFTHQELANRVGSSREMVSKILKDLRVGEYIVVEGQEIVIQKPLPDRW
ncbi:MAG: Crp/Fnr family transcriptional regulator [Granulosicoccus sp.]